jgi:hypothetical protein
MSRPLGCARRSVPIGPQWQPGSIGRALGAFPWVQQFVALAWRQNETHDGAALPRASSQILTLRSSIRFAAGAAPPKPHIGTEAGGAGSQSSKGLQEHTTLMLQPPMIASPFCLPLCSSSGPFVAQCDRRADRVSRLENRQDPKDP